MPPRPPRQLHCVLARTTHAMLRPRPAVCKPSAAGVSYIRPPLALPENIKLLYEISSSAITSVTVFILVQVELGVMPLAIETLSASWTFNNIFVAGS